MAEYVVDWRDRLVRALKKAAQRAGPASAVGQHDSGARATLAKLRRAAGREFDAAAFGWVVNQGIPKSRRAENDAMLIASLFAINPAIDDAGLSFGNAMNALYGKTDSESIRHRFGTLLETRREDLDDKLRHAVKLLKSHEISLDWRQLLVDLGRWDNLRRPVQRQWARDFWKKDFTETLETANS